MKLYTRTGDDGTTGLFGGGRVGKDHPRVDAYGTVDELNACVGLAAAACVDDAGTTASIHERYRAIFSEMQSRLFDIGADLATPEGAKHESKILRLGEDEVAEVEGWIDEIDAANPPMTTFVLPGGTDLAARLHVARTVCRRAERMMVSLAHTEPISEGALTYVNRLSDLLFAMARRANSVAGVTDVPWIPARRRESP